MLYSQNSVEKILFKHNSHSLTDSIDLEKVVQVYLVQMLTPELIENSVTRTSVALDIKQSSIPILKHCSVHEQNGCR